MLKKKRYYDLQNLFWYYENTPSLYPQLNLAYRDKTKDNQFFNFETDKKIDADKFIPFCECKRCSETIGGKCIVKGIDVNDFNGQFAIRGFYSPFESPESDVASKITTTLLMNQSPYKSQLKSYLYSADKDRPLIPSRALCYFDSVLLVENLTEIKKLKTQNDNINLKPFAFKQKNERKYNIDIVIPYSFYSWPKKEDWVNPQLCMEQKTLKACVDNLNKDIKDEFTKQQKQKKENARGYFKTHFAKKEKIEFE